MAERAEMNDLEARVALLQTRARLHGLTLPTVGTSMLPSLPPGRVVTVDADRRARFGDVVAFVDNAGQLIVHRFVVRTRGRMRCLGDNRWNFDPDVPASRLIGPVDVRRRVLGHGGHVVMVLARVALLRVRRALRR